MSLVLCPSGGIEERRYRGGGPGERAGRGEVAGDGSWEGDT